MLSMFSAIGEYPWVYQNFFLGKNYALIISFLTIVIANLILIVGLTNFYNFRDIPLKFGVAYPGFHDFYQEGGWPGHPGKLCLMMEQIHSEIR